MASTPQHRAKPLSEQVQTGTLLFGGVMLLLICCLVLTQVLLVNAGGTRGYELQLLLREQEALLRENEALSMQISDLQTLEALRSSTSDFGTEREVEQNFLITESELSEIYLPFSPAEPSEAIE